jgi:precorrin-6B methylase 1
MKITITTRFYLNDKLLNVGDTVEVPDAVARNIIARGRATAYTAVRETALRQEERLTKERSSETA